MSAKLDPGTLLGGRYRVQRLVGRGGFGAVYVAADETGGGSVAIKVLAMFPGDDKDIVERFLREGITALSVDHPGVPRVLGLNLTPAGAPYLVMEYLEGSSVADFVDRQRRLTPGQASAVMAPVLEVLAAAHRHGIIHRDLKPSNVMLVPGQRAVKVLDFGISKLLDQNITRTGTPMGTPNYMPPELAVDGKRASPQSDLYSAGAMLFELLTGHPPFEGGNVARVMNKVIKEYAPPLQSMDTGASPALCALVDRLLLKSPDARGANAEAVRRELLEVAPPDVDGLWNAVGQGGGNRAVRDASPTDESAPAFLRPDPSTVQPVTERQRRSLLPLGVFLGAVGVGVLVTVAALSRRDGSPPPPAPVPPAPTVAVAPPVEPEPAPPPPLPAMPDTGLTREIVSRNFKDGVGLVRFVVKPWATVTCERNKQKYRLGDTPFEEKQLPQGVYSCTFVNSELGTQRQIVIVTPGGLTKVEVRF